MKILKYWLPVVLWGLVIFSFSSVQTPKTSQIYWQDFIVKKLAHITEYAIFAVLLYRAFRSQGLNRTQSGTLAVFIAAGYGGTDEFHQVFTSGREPTVRDVVFDTIGGVIGIYIVWSILPKIPKKLRNLAAKLDLL